MTKEVNGLNCKQQIQCGSTTGNEMTYQECLKKLQKIYRDFCSRVKWSRILSTLLAVRAGNITAVFTSIIFLLIIAAGIRGSIASLSWINWVYASLIIFLICVLAFLGELLSLSLHVKLAKKSITVLENRTGLSHESVATLFALSRPHSVFGRTCDQDEWEYFATYVLGKKIEAVIEPTSGFSYHDETLTNKEAKLVESCFIYMLIFWLIPLPFIAGLACNFFELGLIKKISSDYQAPKNTLAAAWTLFKFHLRNPILSLVTYLPYIGIPCQNMKVRLLAKYVKYGITHRSLKNDPLAIALVSVLALIFYFCITPIKAQSHAIPLRHTTTNIHSVGIPTR